MATKPGLGKGLDALLAGTNADETRPASVKSGETRIALDKIKANPAQPRKQFDEDSLNELAASIREHGIIQPVILEATANGSYLIVAGERRCRAARLAGLKEVPAVVRNYGDTRRLEVALIENVQRQDLNPLEEAAAYLNLMEVTGLSQEEVAARVGKNRSTIANALRLLKLPQDIQAAVASGAVSSGQARAILAVTSPANQVVLYKRILDEGLSVRDAEKLALELNGSARPAVKKAASAGKKVIKADTALADLEQQFIEALGTKVAISGGLKKGSIRIDYYSMDDLDRIYQLVAKKD